MDDLLQDFLTETSENLALLYVELVKFEQNPNDADALGSIFRLMHTIKGTCGFLGLPRLERVAHAGEDVLDRFRSGTLTVSPQAVTLVLTCLDRIREIVAALEATGQEPSGDDEPLIKLLRALSTGMPLAPSAPAVVELAPAPADEPSPDGGETSDITDPVDGGPVFSDDGFPVAAELLAEVAAAQRDEAVDHSADQDQPVEDQWSGAAEHGEPSASSVLPAAPASATVGKTVVDPARVNDGAARKTPVAAQTIRVSVDVLESLMTLASELVLTRNQLAQRFRGKTSAEFAEPFQRLSLITTDLQEGVMKTRMQPIGNAWAKLPRLIRDLSLETGKKIDLKMLGAETELDRQVLEMIRDPLTHMIRNSADHGIEGPEERREVGKPETGSVILNAYHESGHIVITVTDDGKGLDHAKIGRKAVEQGLVTASELDRLSDQQIQQFIFKAGLTTAETVTSVSGRGVGMDVVRTNIEKIGGTIEFRSILRKGTTFTVKIPLTLGIVSALIVGCGEQRYAIPQIAVRELVRVSAGGQNEVETVNGTPVLRLRNRLLPLVRLHDILRIGPDADAGRGSFYVVVTRVGSRDFGIVVSQLFDTEEIVIKPVARMLRKIPVYSGNTILGDGSVVMILDPNGIAQAFEGTSVSTVDEAAESTDTEREQRTPLIIFRAGGPSPKAVPMALVARIEQIQSSVVELANGRPVVQYRGQLMPLVAFEEPVVWNGDKKRPVLVFSDGDRSIGLLVDEIVDVVEALLDDGTSGGHAGLVGTSIIDGKATDIIDIGHFISHADAEWFGRDESSPAPSCHGDGRRILLVDDSPFFLKLIGPKLVVRGYKVTTAQTAQQALALLEQGKTFDLIVSDIEMPIMDGFAFAEAVRADDRWVDVPLVALSSKITPKNAQRGRDAGFTEMLSKSRRNDLVQLLGRMLEQYGEAA